MDSLIFIHKYLTGQLNEQELDALDHWRRHDPTNERLFQEVKRLWEVDTDIDLVISVDALDRKREELLSRIKTRSIVSRRVVVLQVSLLVSVAACILLGVLFYASSMRSSLPLVMHYISQNGVTCLPDSSFVTMHGSTTLSYQETIHQRVIDFSGAAFFQIKPGEKSFVIRLPDGEVHITGTRFFLSTVDGYSQISVTEGRVTLGTRFRQQDLKKGEMAKIVAPDSIVTLSPLREQNFSSWYTRTLVFEQQPLAQLVKELERCYGETIVIESNAIADCAFTGVFKDEPLETILQVLSVALNFHYHYQQGHYFLTGTGC